MELFPKQRGSVLPVAQSATTDWSTRWEKADAMLLFTSSRPRMLPAAATSMSKREHTTFILTRKASNTFILSMDCGQPVTMYSEYLVAGIHASKQSFEKRIFHPRGPREVFSVSPFSYTHTCFFVSEFSSERSILRVSKTLRFCVALVLLQGAVNII